MTPFRTPCARTLRPLVAAFLLGALAACGVDGDPERPAPRPDAPVTQGVTITGTAQIGVSGGS